MITSDSVSHHDLVDAGSWMYGYRSNTSNIHAHTKIRVLVFEFYADFFWENPILPD